MGKNRAISIGINKYDFLQPLKYAKRDAELMQEFLCNQAGFEQVLLFSDDSTPDFMGRSTRPSFTNLRRVLRTMFDKPFMGDGDNFWFFFSGHGVPDNGCDYIMPVDGDPGDVANTAIPISYVTQCLRRCGADNVLLILDACRKQGTRSGEGIGKQTADIARETGVISIFSCSPNQYSYEIETLQQGVFTSALLEGLGIQGKCATVERLNHYLSWRVPELIRQHKSEKVRQTPYTIAEPVTKSHLIILPQYATLADIAALKIDAFQAEAEKNFELAEQLWIRVLAAASGKDMYAIQAIKRIDRLQRENEVSSQHNSVSASVAKQSESPLSPKSTPLANTTPTEADVPLISKRGVDYTNLRDLLAAGKWKQADRETAKVMLQATRREIQGSLSLEDIEKFPCEDLRIINQLWINYSDGRFGFSVQKRIWESVNKNWYISGQYVGWCVNGRWTYYDDLIWSTAAPEGHLPLGGVVLALEGMCYVRWRGEALVSRYEALFYRLELQSEQGVDYTKLRDLLATGKWQEADQETARLMLQIVGKEGEWLFENDIKKIPLEDLRIIDKLWVKYSERRFGFSVQKRILESVNQDWIAFSDRVGWRTQDRWILYDNLIWSISAPEGHHPSFGRRHSWWAGGKGILFSRMETDKL